MFQGPCGEPSKENKKRDSQDSSVRMHKYNIYRCI